MMSFLKKTNLFAALGVSCSLPIGQWANVIDFPTCSYPLDTLFSLNFAIFKEKLRRSVWNFMIFLFFNMESYDELVIFISSELSALAPVDTWFLSHLADWPCLHYLKLHHQIPVMLVERYIHTELATCYWRGFTLSHGFKVLTSRLT